jgi:hypothetical protein
MFRQGSPGLNALSLHVDMGTVRQHGNLFLLVSMNSVEWRSFSRINHDQSQGHSSFVQFRIRGTWGIEGESRRFRHRDLLDMVR